MLEDLKALNLHYLMVLREHALGDKVSTTQRFNVKMDFIGRIISMNAVELQALADCDALVFTARVGANIPRESLPDDLKELNLHYLMVLRDQALRDAISTAQRFNVKMDFIGRVVSMSLEELQRVAGCELSFAARISAQTLPYLQAAPCALRSAMVGVGNHATA